MASKTFKGALQEARKLIENGSKQYICFALQNTDNDRFMERVEDQLSPYCAYESWLAGYHMKTYLKMTPKDFREGRLQWIDHMISKEK